MAGWKQLLLLGLLAAALTDVSCRAHKVEKKGKTGLIDSLIHDIQIVNDKTWDSHIAKNRTDHVFVIFFYDPTDEAKDLIRGAVNDAATRLKDMIIVGGVDCSLHESLCKRLGIKTRPSLYFYPVLPFPAVEYTERPYSVDKIVSMANRMVPGNHVKEISSKNHTEFIHAHVSVPKVFLFTEKTKVPVIFKVLSNHFKDKIHFGVVHVSKEAEVVKKMEPKNYPEIRLTRHGKPDQIYKDSIDYRKLRDWLNVFAETFVMGGGYSHTNEVTESKPWKYQKIPQLSRASHMDICFKKNDKGLCVIYLKSGDDLTADEEKMLDGLRAKSESKMGGRGVEFKWMWLNVEPEATWRQEFGLDLLTLPSCMIFNPVKKLRYFKLDDKLTASADNIAKMVEKVTGGDARFTIVKGNVLPALVPNVAAEKEEL